jgi:putative PIG3 family NAD(P)H quinone oxidoreductase
MRAVVCDGAGDVDVLTIGERPDPEPGSDEVVIDVRAAGVNAPDLAQRRGLYPPPPGASDVLGLECSGVVSAVGDDVDRWRVGDEVCALLNGGGYAERVAVPAAQVLPIPTGVELEAAAGLPEVVATVWSNVFMLAGLHEGETLLVHGGAGGIGTMAIQLGKAFGARVAVTAGSPEKLARCAELGADIGIDHKQQDFVEELRAATDGHGADVILDIIGGAYLPRNVEALATAGRLVVIGTQRGATGELSLNRLQDKRGAVLATRLRPRPPGEKAAIIGSVEEHVWPLVESGTVRPVVHQVYPLDDVREAHRTLEASTHVGKVLLRTPASPAGR